MAATGPPPHGRRPAEPTGPSQARASFSRRWFLGWSGAGVAVGTVLAVAWFVAPHDTALLGLLGALTAGCVSVALHHLVVTRDRGERTVTRPSEPAPLTGRRRLVGGVLGGAAVLGVSGLAGLVRFGPEAPEGTTWGPGVRAVTIEGDLVRPDDVPVGGVITVWPERDVGSELSAVMLIRLRQMPLPPTTIAAVVDQTLVAYSRLCTHAGCAVALYRTVDQALFCPCHQATFDARRGATPVSGPASQPLPQLPLAIDNDGYVIATGDLSAPPGAVGAEV
jgi:ubiquinol-cytochrome c reductase iron-sulfur subunit